ncbi:MAG TPA: heme ABC transporter ATP-binding protein [Ohtaekwangia sp.]|nr:heme ABC transporter ATP-binding protein [Ohtaekwangia sp.]
MYEAIDISLKAGERFIVKNVNLAITPGTFLAVVGPNGAGKSSLLKVLSHEQQRYSGSVQVNGMAIRSYTPKSLSLIRAVMPQHSYLQFAFSVEQVIRLARQAHRSAKAVNDLIVEEVLEVTGMQKFRDRNYLTLSGGEQQRVQLARVLAQVWEETVYPRYILLDEPTSNMDIAQQQFMFNLVKNICPRNIGVMAIVHDVNLAIQYADNICMMRNGEVIDSGKSFDVFTKTNIEKTFCCKVNIYHDPCNNCPFVIPEAEISSMPKIAINK